MGATLLWLGDSTVAGVDGTYPESEPDIRFVPPLTGQVSLPGYVLSNRAVGGQTLGGVLAGQGVLEYSYNGQPILPLATHLAALPAGSMVVLEGGINDAYVEAAVFDSQLEQAIALVAGAGFRLVLQTPNRMSNGRQPWVWAKAAQIRAKAAQHGLGLIDVHYGVTVWTPQGTHPTAAGYAEMGRFAQRRLQQLLDPAFPAQLKARAVRAALIGA